ncbi:MAG: endonuclease/exonuclease/phosphatase family protein [Gallionellaceae bacterium]|jgi:endonuclease/exonuclease/phosphatase family metal-dependent hydrolase
MTELSIATYNIHKGFSLFNRRYVIHELRDRLRELNADVMFLQEVQGAHSNIVHQENLPHAQHEFLAHELWPHHAYGKNSVYAAGHHGNAILSRYPIVSWHNQDISAHRFESRGVLHCDIQLPGHNVNLHCLCVHLGLFKRGRSVQFKALVERIREEVPEHAPLIIAGDFNDWNNNARISLEHELGLNEVFQNDTGGLARSFPAGFPMLRLDRIYVRGLNVKSATVHSKHPWSKISDHAALSARLSLP